MDRRSSLKYIALSAFSGVLLDACKPADKKATLVAGANGDGNLTIDRTPEEAAHEKKLASEQFFTEHEMATIAVLSDIIIPADDVSGSATDAKVPEFIEFIVKDMPDHQVPMRGGLRWLDLQMANRHGKAFKDCTKAEQIAMVDAIAYPGKAAPEMKQGVAFFNRMRGLTATGFFTSEMGIKDLGYMGNRPNQWNGIPADVLKQYNLAYSEKEIKECVQYT
ncbi:gluconate 2-dehydrogenase subunit 3 family protein [Paracnuella aquatica]|uniref:gluconate 2-dehydrogenase subunit 3 family protein n=1 Tax=Paracnuella aquatica TaxID=2268757 RepID=UPI000DEEF838|nr:gluconate 2-dehydrogenase subunit 3 family protein [Paracnuella aquatica]RPD49075.1 gluconate 2-dehydrogenase subunit 3 family protein [Paracnuella aquatica]